MNSTKLFNVDISEAARKAAGLVVRVAFVAFALAMAFAIYRLGEMFNQPATYSMVVAVGCVAGILGHGAIMTRQDTNASRALHGVSLAIWLVLSVMLASIYMTKSSPDIAPYVPDELVTIGAFVYALVWAVGLFTVTLALVIPSVSGRPVNDPDHPSLGSVVARFVEPLVLILAVAASSMHLYTFGMEVAKVGMFSTVFAMVIADLAFLGAEKKVVTEIKRRRVEGRYDKADLVLWGAFALFVAAYLFLVNVYMVRFTSGALDMADPMLKMVVDFYGASPTALIFAYAGLALITAFVDIEGGANATKGRPTLARLADQIVTQRQALGELREAVTISKPAQKRLTTTTAKDSEAGEIIESVPAEGVTDSAGDGVPRKSKSGKSK